MLFLLLSDPHSKLTFKKGKGHHAGFFLCLWLRNQDCPWQTWAYLPGLARAGRRSWHPRRATCWCTGGTARSPSAWSPLVGTSGRRTSSGHLCCWNEISCKINFTAVCSQNSVCLAPSGSQGQAGAWTGTFHVPILHTALVATMDGHVLEMRVRLSFSFLIQTQWLRRELALRGEAV